MKRRNNIFTIIGLAIVALIATIAVGCNSAVIPFDAPTVTLTDSIISWAATDGATNGYTVKINEDETTRVAATSLDLITVKDKLVEGKNSIAVKVNAVDEIRSESAYSQAVEYNYSPSPIDPPPAPTVVKITITGADDAQIKQGTFFNYFADVTAVGDNGVDYTSKIVVSGNFNSAVAGEYTLVYSVNDGNGNSAQKERVITVTANEEIGKVDPTPTFTYTPSEDDPNASPYYNIAKGCKTTANSVQGNASADYATDGDMSTRWESAHGADNVNFTVDLGAELTVSAVNIYWEAAYAKSFDLLVSTDGVSFSTVEQIQDQTLHTDNLINSFDFTSARQQLTARFIRIACTKRSGNYGYSIYEFEALGTTGTVIPTESYPVLFDARKNGSPDWTVEAQESVVFDLGSPKTIDSIRLAFKSYIKPLGLFVYYGSTQNDYTAAIIKNLPYSADTYGFYASSAGDAARLTLNSVRYIKVDMDGMSFDSQALRITSVEFGYTETNGDKTESKKIDNKTVSVTASSHKTGHEAALMLDNDDGTYWENENDTVYKTIDLGEVKAVGRVDLYWRGDDGGKGKYYDLQISSNGTNWTTAFRQTHGATPAQSIYLYENARYIRVIDYQSGSADRFMLEGAVVHSQYPASSGEGKVDYDVSIKLPEYGTVELGNGSYLTGGTDFPSSRLIAYLDDSLRDKPVPSNDWWQGLLIADKGYNMYMNPLTATFMSDGLWLTNPGAGYFSGIVPGNGSHTVNVDAHDLAVGYAGMGANATVRVTGYSDYGMSAVMTDRRGVDKLTAFLSQGSLYAYCLFAEPEKALLLAKDFIGFYDIDGNEILTENLSTFTGDCIVVKVLTHASYEGGIQKYKDTNGQEREHDKIYEERYYVVSVPDKTTFIRGEDSVSVVMTEGNYMSVGAVAQKNAVKYGERSSAAFPKAEVALLHEHGYAFVINTGCTYDFDGDTNKVTTEFRVSAMLMRTGFSAEAYSAYMPHQLSKSDYNGGYVYASIRGDCRSFVGNSFTTTDTFYGIVPTFTEPTDDGYSSQVLYDQLLMLYNNNGGDKAPGKYLISGDPYWQGKNLHPMAMAALAADQIGATDLRDAFLDKIEYILVDWFTYDPVDDLVDDKHSYFYYDSEWGTLYYKNSEFGAGVNLADHYFTYGYYTLASGVLASFRPEFAADWGDMVELLIRDYMNPSRTDELFPYMRNFDPFSGHGWAGGYADNNGGNNQESAGEALNSWVGAYLYATAVGNEQIRTAAIYGYTTELNAIKHYWFNYYGDFAESYPYGVVGQVYGGSNFYGTFFNGEPLYMYGIHLIPGEEYLTSYALNESERGMLEGLIDAMRKDQAMWEVTDPKDNGIHAWQHIFIPIVAIYDPDEALEWYDQVLAEQGNVGNTSEQFNVYWLIHGMKTTGGRSTDIYAADGATATVYEKNGKYTALCWNPTGAEKKIIFKNAKGEQVGYAVVPANSLVSCDPTEQTTSFVSYTDVSNFKLGGIAESTNATMSGGKLTLGSNGSASYLLTFGSEEAYYRIKITGASGVKLAIDGQNVELGSIAGGCASEPVSLSFKHTITVSGSNAEITSIRFEKLTLNKQNVGMTATASSTENAENIVSNAVDGSMDTRWESRHADGDEAWLQVELAEPTTIYQLRIYWEAASAKEYKVYLSQTGADGDWTEVFHGNYSQGARTDYVTPSTIMNAKYIRIEGISRTTTYGYSIYELEVYNFN
ncbi:MAG: DUF5011 domain-containing protein [Clostridiales bacterium]|nr:DUF5011 domain-containing protein [Clostridiales bacterium]